MTRQVIATAACGLILACSGARPSTSTDLDGVAEGGATSSSPGGRHGRSPPGDGPPRTRREAVVDDYHGVRVVDPYRWMEGPSRELDDWFAAQNAYTRRMLRTVAGRDALRDELRTANRDVGRVESVEVVGSAPLVFSRRRAAAEENAQLVVRHGWEGTDRVLVDPRQRNSGASHASIDHMHPSPDGRYVAYVLAAAGGEDGTIEIVDVRTGQVLPDRLDRVLGYLVSWRPDSRSFFYTRRAKAGPDAAAADWLRNSATYLHVIGHEVSASPVIATDTSGLGLRSEDVTWVGVTPRSRWALAGGGTVSDFVYFVAPLATARPGKARWRRVAGADDKVRSMLVHGDRLYAFTHAGAPNYRIVSFDAGSGTLSNAKDFLAASELVLVNFTGAKDAMYVVALDRGIHRLLRVPWETGRREEVELPFEGSIWELEADQTRPGLVFQMEGWTRRPGWFRFDPGKGVSEVLGSSAPAAFEGVMAEEATAVSRDGAEVPLSIIRRADRPLDGTAPGFLSGYGAYGLGTGPSYNPFPLTWVKRGGVYAVCHVRGSGARGKSWHLAGIKQNKENGVDDLIACAEYLVEKRYTSSSRLAVSGTSAGGILVGGAITKRPDLFRTALLRVPVVNLLRNELMQMGPANASEYGSVKVKSEFEHLLASDPYHRVRDGVDYPAVLLTAGLRDPRVAAWQPAKLAARLQATGRGGPILLRVEYDAGHGIGSTQTQREEEYADMYAFALWQAGLLERARTTDRGD